MRAAIIGALFDILGMLLTHYRKTEPTMEVAQLARAFVLLIALLKDEGMLLDGPDAGRQQMIDELRAITQVYTERTRAQERFHITPRGQAALARADELDEKRAQAEKGDAEPA